MNKKINHIEAYILAGGKSSRMGTDKGLLPFREKVLVEWIIEKLQQVFEKVTIISNNKEYKVFNIDVVEDIIKENGPAGGIFTALQHSKANKIFVVSCDMPFITKQSIEFIVEKSINSEITIPVFENKIQPLFGVYAKQCFKQWQQLVEQKMTKLQEMITHFNALKIDVTNHELFNKNVFMNVNDKNDLAKALQNFNHEN